MGGGRAIRTDASVRSIALLPAVALLTGVLVGITMAPPSIAWAMVAWVAGCGSWAVRTSRLATVFSVIGFALAGAVLGGRAASDALRPSIRTVLEEAVGGFALTSIGPPGAHEPIATRMRLVEDAAALDHAVSARAELESVQLRGAERRVRGGVRLSIGGAAAVARAGKWRAGRTIDAPVTFRRPARYLNEGVPDIERDLALDGIALYASVKSGLLVQVVRRGNWFEESAADVRSLVRTRVGTWVGSRDALAGAIVTAILIGDRTGLPDEARARLQAAGTYHVIAISGGNIAILAALIAGLFIVTGTTGRLSAAVIIVLLLAYAAVVDAGPSVWRATATAIAYLAARIADHRSPPWNAMAVSAMVLACASPLDVRDVGFALTFGATAAIVEAARRVRGVRGGPAAWIAASVAASTAAEIALLPMAAIVFSRVTFAGVLLNLLAVPLMTVAQIAGLAVVAGGGAAWIAAPAGAVAAASAGALVESARLVEVAPWLAIRVPAPSLAVAVVYYIALAGALWLRGEDVKRTAARRFCAATALLSALLILTGAAPAVRSQGGDGRLRFIAFDVGQGDALLLQTPGGGTVMVDTGGVGADGAAFDIGGRVLAPALWAAGVRRLDLLALTHGDPDHIGGARAVLRDFAPRAMWEGVPVPGHLPSQQVAGAARAAGVRIEHPHPRREFDLDGVAIRVLHPPPPDWERQRVRNDDSLVLEIRYRDVALLLTGDAGAEVEHAIAPMLTRAPIRILKVGHHGSRTSTSRALVDAWQPQIAVISCGRGNRFGHPAPDVLNRLDAAGVRIYRTDRDGQITIATDGKTVDVHTFTGERR